MILIFPKGRTTRVRATTASRKASVFVTLPPTKIVDAAEQLVARDGDDGEGPHPFPGAEVPPVLPKPCQTERRAILHGDRIGLLAALGRLPFEEPVNRDDAAAQSVGVSKGRSGRARLGFRIDRLRAAFRILAPVGD